VAAAECPAAPADEAQALLRLGAWDLRRSLTLVQTNALAAHALDAANVYRCAGYPALLDQGSRRSPRSRSSRGEGAVLLNPVRESHRQTTFLEIAGPSSQA
jgi:hypothetical protein